MKNDHDNHLVYCVLANGINVILWIVCDRMMQSSKYHIIIDMKQSHDQSNMAASGQALQGTTLLN